MRLSSMLALLVGPLAPLRILGAQGDAPRPAAVAPASEPFAFADFTWLNGTMRQRSALLDSEYF